MKDSTGRAVCDLEFEFNSDGSAFITSATYDDDEAAPVPENELECLNDNHPEECEEASQDRSSMRAEDAYDRARGH